MKALVVGARGAVGSVVAGTLRAAGHDVTEAGRRAPADGISLDLSADDGAAFAAAAREHDVVVNASGAENPRVGGLLADTAFVDISASSRYLRALRDAAPRASVVLGAGIAPGITTVLVSELATRAGDQVDVTVVLGSGEKHGAAAIAWTVGLIGSTIDDAAGDGPVMNLHEHRWFTDDRGPRPGEAAHTRARRRRYLRADFPDNTLADPHRRLDVRSWLALSSPVMTLGLAVIARAPRFAAVAGRVPAVGDERWAVRAVNRRTGQSLGASGRGQSAATGIVTAEAAIRIAASPSGSPVALDRVLDLDTISRLDGITVD